MISYQGRVSVGGVNFDGTGVFKFALVNAAGTTTYWSNDGTSAAGSEPTNAVSLTVTGGAYSVLLGDATLPNMTAVPSSVFENNDAVYLRIWFNDGSNGSLQLSPDHRMAATGYSRIAGAVPDNAITSNKVAAGAVTSAKIVNDAVTAAEIADGSITNADLASLAAANNLAGVDGIILSANAAAPDLLADGFVNLGTLDGDGASIWLPVAGVETDAIPARRLHTAVWTGTEMIVWGGLAPASTRTGGRYNPATDSWTPTTLTGAPLARSLHTAIWTGSRMIVWGGNGLATGGRYDPIADSWAATTTTGAPAGRSSHTAVWTGTAMIVWGGDPSGAATETDTGGRYDPASNTWTTTSLTNTPIARRDHTAVWTGTRMIVWGGDPPVGTSTNTGGRYHPSTDSWTATSLVATPTPRQDHTAVWTGTEMIVWGPGPSGGRYDPATDSWKPTPGFGPPTARDLHTAIWTGAEMIVWGGRDATGTELTGGRRYDPVTDHWMGMNSSGQASVRRSHTAVWTGSEMIVWGGLPDTTDSGSRYNPVTHSWTPMADSGSDPNTPAGRALHSAVWTGAEMIVWGGNPTGAATETDTGGRYNPATNSWTPTTITGAPSARLLHTAVWTGTEMIVWGGDDAVGDTDTGARYTPASDSWTATSTTSAPVARDNHTAVWTGSQMIVWSGLGAGVGNSGGRYDPAGDTWTATTLTSGPAARRSHTAVWTGSEMIVWGGDPTTAATETDTGGRYNPSTDSWTATTLTDAPIARTDHSAIWTGSQMIVWGGDPAGDVVTDTGGRYNPATDSWTATRAVAPPNVPATPPGYTGVWTGTDMIVWGGDPSGSTLRTNTGARYNPAGDAWTPTTTTGAPLPAELHTAVWTGTEMIVWGGESGAFDTELSKAGGRYNPTTDSWTPVAPTPGPPANRTDHTAVWTGTEMIVWGGDSDPILGNYRNTGARYNPATNAWVSTSMAGVPQPRRFHTAVWSGTEMIVWGGRQHILDTMPPFSIIESLTDSGARYNPITDTWIATVNATTDANTPSARDGHTAVWTGTEMIVWGGDLAVGGSKTDTGGRYNPSTDSWTAAANSGTDANTPSSRSDHTAVWTGSRMIIWGGLNGFGLDTGSQYDPVGDTWTAATTTGAPAGRFSHTAVWTGTEMVVWGGSGTGGDLNTGGRYDPATNAWTATDAIDPDTPAGRSLHTAVWTGERMIVWGGDPSGGATETGTGSFYDPLANSWAPVPLGGPAARRSHTAVWTGTEMIVWGGASGSSALATGGRLKPNLPLQIYAKP